MKYYLKYLTKSLSIKVISKEFMNGTVQYLEKETPLTSKKQTIDEIEIIDV